jgi:tRNA (guanine10-N2)-dimethyltransferase
LIEADRMGLDAIGMDKDREMLWGAKANMDFYKVDAKTDEGDATNITIKNVDAIVTDPPYARSSKMFSKGLEHLYDEFMSSAFESLKSGGYLVMAVPKEARVAYARVGFELSKNFLFYVHKSLIRSIYILKKPN